MTMAEVFAEKYETMQQHGDALSPIGFGVPSMPRRLCWTISIMYMKQNYRLYDESKNSKQQG